MREKILKRRGGASLLLGALALTLLLPRSAQAVQTPLIWQANVAQKGQWETLPNAPVEVVHAALLRTGKVLMWAMGYEANLPFNSALWDPVTGAFTVLPPTQNDLFCSHHTFLANGKLLVNGGDSPHMSPWTYIFDPGTETWTKKPDMAHPRWYPTTITLPNGAGAITFEGEINSLEWEVLNTTSPVASIGAPNDSPSKTVPSSRMRNAFDVTGSPRWDVRAGTEPGNKECRLLVRPSGQV